LIVPYPFHRDRQQLHNARVLERVGAARVVEQHALDVERIVREVRPLLADPGTLDAMGRAARALQDVDACTRIVEDLEERVLQRPDRRGGGR
jgi:UDP-N-acetylglucosamine--N-acetylmuramyl-(pentapeptide) pyrophosphoryl-undecaprenol N-acetylglucosamine transferase